MSAMANELKCVSLISTKGDTFYSLKIYLKFQYFADKL